MTKRYRAGRGNEMQVKTSVKTIYWRSQWDARVLDIVISLIQKADEERRNVLDGIDAAAKRGMCNPVWVWEWSEARDAVRVAVALGLTTADLRTIRCCLLAEERAWLTGVMRRQVA